MQAFARRARKLGLTENRHRRGSWGRTDADGNFREVARIDPGIPGGRGFKAKTHIHINGQKVHLPSTPLPGE